MSDNQTEYFFPPTAVLYLYSHNKNVFQLAVFPFLNLIKEKNSNASDDEEYKILEYWGDKLPQKSDKEKNDLIQYLYNNLSWDEVKDYIALKDEDPTRHLMGYLWTNKKVSDKDYRIDLSGLKTPKVLYRYMRPIPERLCELIQGRFYFPCPAQFNDPFDCSLNSKIRFSFIEAGIACFSAKKDSVLMFSHYADNHRGVCIGFDTTILVKSIQEKMKCHASIRPVWYFIKLPKLDIGTQPALCATVKDRIWGYEKEYRLFVSNASEKLLPHGHYSYDSSAIKEIIFGCKASDDFISKIKKETSGLANLEYLRASQIEDKFGIDII